MVRILISNDDGIHAPGIRALKDALQDLGEVWVVAPDRERSAASHSITLHEPLRFEQHRSREYAVSGTPTDAVYLALHHLLDAPPDIVVSGINRGANLGNDVLYSGTVAAAMEGALFGHPAIALSMVLDSKYGQGRQPSDYHVAANFARALSEDLLSKPAPKGVVLNVNVPEGPKENILGTKVCRLGFSDWTNVIDDRQDPRGRNYFWIGGDRVENDTIDGSDNAALREGYITLTPIHYDITDYRSLAFTRTLNAEGFQAHADELGSGVLPHPTISRRGPQT